MVRRMKASRFQLHRLTTREIGENWPHIEQVLHLYGDLIQDIYTPDHVLARALSEDIQVWFLTRDDEVHLVIFSQFLTTFVSRIFQVFFAAGGDLVENLPLIDGLYKFGQQGGATKFEIQGRPGFLRVLKPFGFELEHLTYSKPIKAMLEN